MSSRNLLLLLLGAVLASCQQPPDIVVRVDPVNGNDTCMSVHDLQALAPTDRPRVEDRVACRTINRALGDVTFVNVTVSCQNPDPIFNFEVLLEDGVHDLTRGIGMIENQNATLRAVNRGMARVRCENFPNTEPRNFDNMYLCNSTGVLFAGILFEMCGPVASNVFISDSSDIRFENCTFTNNEGAPLRVQFSNDIQLVNTDFLNNTNKIPAEPDEGETSIEELYQSITTAGGFTYFNREAESNILIQGCRFADNSANMNDPNNTRPVLLKANGHGGAILIRLAGVQDSTITIQDCQFVNNFAQVDGGAVYFSISENVRKNSISFINTKFVNNEVDIASGGAVSINSFNISYDNTINVTDCHFELNVGNAGGAFSVALYNSNLESTQMPDAVNFCNCTFLSNAATNEGTAVGLFSLVHVDQVGFPVSFTDCTFDNNTSLESTEDTSAIAAFRFPTMFSGVTRFVRNRGGGVTLLNTQMIVQENASLYFDSNTAVFGAGIAMDDRCLLEISPGVNMTFINNVAMESGGGIYVEFPPIRFVVDIFNRLCFLQYSDGTGTDVPPQEWNGVTIKFMDNRARLSGAAIYASDMQQCSWLGANTTEGSLIFNPPENLTTPFEYINNELLPEGQNVSRLADSRLATAPSTIHFTVEHLLVQPGEVLPINLLATDQVNNSREAVWSLEAPAQAANLDALSANNDTYLYTVPEADDLLDRDGMEQVPQNFSTNFTLNFSLLRTLGSISTLGLQVNGCHPGFVLENGACVCDTGNTNILRCDDNNRYLYLREGIWGGVENGTDGTRRLITARVQPGYVTCRPQGRLPGCLFEFDDVTAQCREGREGPLCGTCIKNHGVTLDLQNCTGTTCVAGLLLFIGLCILVVVVSLLILFFNVELPNELKGFLFYAQVIGLIYRPYVVVQTTSNSTDVLGILVNLLGFSVPIPLCLSTTMQAHHVGLLGYISPILALLTVSGYAISARYVRALSNRSALKGITFLSLFIYKYIADTSFIFISCLATNFGLVFQYDGSVSCNSLDFGFFALIGLVLVVFFVTPAPFITGYICIKRPQRFQHYADVLTKELKQQHRWWGGWDIGRRLPFVFIAYFVVLARPSLVLFFMSLAALAVLVIHLFVKPYQKMYINVIEAAILLNLLMVTAAFLDPSNSPVPMWFSTLLVILPYVYLLGYITVMLAKYLWKRFGSMVPEKSKSQPANKLETSASTDATQSDKPTQTTVVSSEGGSELRERRFTTSGEEDGVFAVLREPLLDT